MKTSEYQWYRPDFWEYNVAQEAVVPFCDQDCNMVVSFATAVGKTVLAECCFGYHLQAFEDGVVAYVAPYRSLCVEKYERWKDDIHFSADGVAIRTGDMTSPEYELLNAGMTVMTCESFDVRTRREQWREWIESLECVVFDEAHMIGDKTRGVALEAAIMRLTAINPDCRVVMLSATMDNAFEIAKWLKSLNGKQTKCFTSDWRPNEVSIVEHPVTGWNEAIDKTVEVVASRKGKTLVFVHSKKMGATLTKRIKKVGINTAFHNGSVPKARREKMERLFDDPSSGFDVLVSTSTLGAGVNKGG